MSSSRCESAGARGEGAVSVMRGRVPYRGSAKSAVNVGHDLKRGGVQAGSGGGDGGGDGGGARLRGCEAA